MRVLGMSIQTNTWLQKVVFHVGDAPITNFAIVRTLGIFVLTYLCVRLMIAVWRRAERSHPNFNASHLYVVSRVSTTTIVVIGIVVALAFLGLDFSKLTLIASALSIGIGFGLKNIIDNISSGAILLFERSIRVGDWVIVGTTEGFVKSISLRSTRIRTWDQADVIVPNSDLITARVTNWTLTKPSGRIRIPLSVAYGTDPKIVEDLLLEVAQSNLEVINDGSTPAPIVLFLGFGESALDFELRCFIKNIVRRFVVISDINYAISLTLGRHSIEVPFPQRDIHIRDWIDSEVNQNA